MANSQKILVIYYSLEGNTAFIAKTIAEAMGADLLELRPQQAPNPKSLLRFFWGGKQVMMKETPALEPLDKDPAAYDLLLMGTPVWASSYAPAFRTFFSTTTLQGKQIGLFCCYAGSEGKTFRNLRQALTGNEIVGEMGFRNPLKDQETNARKASEWARTFLST